MTKLPGSDSETQVIALSAEAVTFQLPSGEEVTLPCQTNGSFWACTDGDLTFTAVPEDGRTVIGHPGRDGRLLEILECRLADGENTETRQ